MRVLVSAASRHGSTAGIAQGIGDELVADGLEADVLDPDSVDYVAYYDAVVLGSSAARIDKRELGLAERAVLRLVRAPDGDYRPWDEIRDLGSGHRHLATGNVRSTDPSLSPRRLT